MGVQPLPRISDAVPASQDGLSLSSCMKPVPQNLVDQARSGKFTELREFLSDNISLVQQLEALQSPAILMPALPGARYHEITSLVHSLLLMWQLVQTSDMPTRDQVTYALLLIKEVQRHGGSGWLAYDRAF